MLTTPPAGYRLFVLGPARDKDGQVWSTDDAGDPLAWDCYATRASTSPVTDLKDEDGNAVTQVSPLGADAGIDEGVLYVFAPTTYGTLYVDRGQGRRVAMWPADTGDLAVQAKSVADQLDTIAATADDAKATADQAKVDADQAKAQQGQLMEVAATTDETGVHTCDVTGAGTYYVLVAAYSCDAVWAAGVFAGSVAVSDTDYVTVSLSGPAGTIVSKSTKATGGEAITAGSAWSFAGAGWNTTAGTLAPGDVLTLTVTATGAVTVPTGRVCLRVKPT